MTKNIFTGLGLSDTLKKYISVTCGRYLSSYTRDKNSM
jgi:hypothetical protein